MARDDVKLEISATDKTRRAFDSARSNIQGLSRSVLGIQSGLAALAGAAGFGALVKNVADSTDKIQKLSISLGASTEALSQYRLIASRSGTTLDSLSLIWQRMTRRTAEAAVGTGEARDALRELGLSAVDLSRLSPDKQFEAIADAMQNVEGQSNRLRLAFKLFDSEGARPALQAMEGGAAALREMRIEADSMGLTITRVQANQMAAFNDRLGDAKLAMKGAADQLVLSLSPAIIGIAEGFATAAKWVGRFFDSFRDDKATIQGVVDEMKEIRDEIAAVPNTPPSMFQIGRLKELQAQYEKLTGAVKEAASAAGIAPGAPIASVADEKAANAAAERAQREEDQLREQMRQRVALILESAQTEQEQLQMQHEERILFLEEAYQNELINFEALQEAKYQLEQDYKQKSESLENKHTKTALKMRGDLARQSIAFLQVLGAKSQVFAKAAILLESIIAAKKIFIESQVAAMAALTPPPIGLGPVAGQPLAASILAMGKISAGLALATGAMQLASTGSGGAALGTFSAEPETGLPSAAVDAAQGRRETRTDITINIGDAAYLSAEGVRKLIDQINEQIDDGVRIGSIALA